MTYRSLGRAAALLALAAAFLGTLPNLGVAAPPAPPAAAPAAAGDKPLFLPIAMRPRDDLVGRWVWVQDSDGTHPAPGVECSLFFIAGAEVDLNCIRPGFEFHDQGSYALAGPTLAGGTITLNLPNVPIAVTSRPYTRSSDMLTLPFLLINEGEGTSLWRREPDRTVDSSDFVAVAYDAYERALELGASDDAAAEAAATALRNREFARDLRAAGSPELFAVDTAGRPLAAIQPVPMETLSEVVLNAQKTGLRLKRENGRVYHIILKPKMPKDDDFRAHPPVEPIEPGFFAGDPRTHRYMEVSSGPNDPRAYTATLLFPMHSQRNYRKGRYFVFKNLGEDPAVLRKQLLRAGYQAGNITVKIDSEVSPKTIADALLRNPGVFYLSTHGVSYTADGVPGFTLVTGTKVVPRAGQTRDEALVQAVLALGLPDYLLNTIEPATIKTDRMSEDLFLAVGDPFFKALRANNPGWDMSRSLVYLDACESTANTSAVELFRAAVLIGWRKTSDPFVGVRYSQHFFRNSVRKTHSAREVWDEIWRVLKTRRSIYQEDVDLDSEDAYERTKLAEEIEIFDAYGSDRKLYKHLGAGLYPNTTPDGVFWLVWLGRWSTNPDTASNNLQSCYDNIWSKNIRGIGAGPFCNAGYRGTHAPTAEEVKEARQLLNGQPTPIPGGRWTLADHIPYSDPVGGPFDP